MPKLKKEWLLISALCFIIALQQGKEIMRNHTTPEESFMAGIQAGLDHVRGMGRGPDTELAHVTPEEVRMLKAAGGAGTINPRTGLREFIPQGMGGMRDVGRQAAGERDRSQRDDRRDVPQKKKKKPAGRGGIADPKIGQAVAERVTSGVSATPGGAEGAGPTGDSSMDQRSLGQRFADAVAESLTSGLEAPRGGELGIMGLPMRAVPGIGTMMTLTDIARRMGLEGEPLDMGPESQREGEGPANILSGRAPEPARTPRYPWSRPQALPEAPTALHFDPAMTPLQQRAAVATGGTNQAAGVYADPAVRDYYRNLALYELTQPGGAPLMDASILPIERQYVEQLSGAKTGASTEDFLRGLMNL